MNLRQHPHHREIWVSEDGRVFRELSPSLDGSGYHQIRNGKFRQRRHVIVAETWVGSRPEGAVVRHKDGDAANDHHLNLCWGSQAENMQDSVLHGRTARGERNKHCKLSEGQALEIKNRRLSGESGKALAEEFGVSESAVCDIAKGRTWGWL